MVGDANRLRYRDTPESNRNRLDRDRTRDDTGLGGEGNDSKKLHLAGRKEPKMKHPDKISIPLLTALSAHYTLSDLQAAHHNNVPVSVAYWPDGVNGPRRRWRGIPSSEQLCILRLLLSAAIGRNPAEYITTSSLDRTAPPDNRSDVGTVYCGYEKIQTWKWTTDHKTRKPIPPNTFCWRDLHTGQLFRDCPALERDAK